MKKLVLAVLGVLCSATMVAGFASCDLLGGTTNSSTPGGTNNSSDTGNSSINTPAVTYTLDTTKFEKTVVFGSALNVESLTIKASTGETVAVTSKMVSGWSTDSVGDKTLTVTYEGNNLSVGYTVKYEVKFEVDGKIVKTQLVTSKDEIVYPTETPEKDGVEFEAWSPATVESLTSNLTVRAQFKGVELPDEATVTIGGDAVYVREFGEAGQLALTASFGALAPADYEVALSNDNITVTEGRNILLVNPVKAGVTTLTLKATDPATGSVAEATKTVVVKPRSLMINEVKLGASDIEGVFTLGGTNANGNVATYDFNVSCGTEADIGAGLTDNVVWESSSNSVTVNSEGLATLAQSGEAELVSLTAKFVVNGVEYDASAPYTVRCVYDGVNVTSYAELYAATKATEAKPIVLHKDIKEDFSATNYDTMNTTYDDTYYQNKGEVAKIKTLLQFKDDLYGNGYQINAHNATLGWVDSTGAPKADALFKGPLNFVAMGAEESGMLSVKAQDNVCFALFEGVTVNNVELRSCDLKADSDGNYDLTDLDYAGTTVEVFGDDVTIEYSRLTNGRTVLRVFGDATDPEKAIHVDIKNSVLSGAREFILRVGSNRFVKDANNASPYLTGDSNGAYLNAKKLNADNYYGKMTAEQKQSYDNSFINTYVNVKNSVFKDAGIFAIGMDTHFAGPALHDPESDKLISSVLGSSAALWKNIAKTSYGAKLTFEGDVRMYNWKPLDQIDSSTLIENLGPEGWTWDSLTFDVKTMVKAVSNDSRFSSIVTQYNDTDYVHAGIAFFGGGRNYSIFENSADSEPLVGFTVSLDDVGQGMLKTAAGEESFYFMLCDQTSRFTPQEQVRILGTDDAYACLKK